MIREVFDELTERIELDDPTEWGTRGQWPETPDECHGITGFDRRFEIMVSAILVQRQQWIPYARDALRQLAQARILIPEGIVDTDIERLRNIIEPAGLVTQKSETLKALAQQVIEAGGVESFLRPATDELRKQLKGIKGIGNETADTILLYCAERPVFPVSYRARQKLQELGLMEEKELRGDAGYHQAQVRFHAVFSSDDEAGRVRHFQWFHALINEEKSPRREREMTRHKETVTETPVPHEEATAHPPAEMPDEREAFYQSIDNEEDRAYIQEQTRLIKTTFIESAIAIGSLLVEVQSRLAQYGQGTFGKWIHLEFPESERSAYNYITLAKAYRDSPQFAQLTDTKRLKKTALTELASASEAAVEEVVELSQQEPVTLKAVREIVAKHKPHPEEGQREQLEILTDPSQLSAGEQIYAAFSELNNQLEVFLSLALDVTGTEDLYPKMLDRASDEERERVEQLLNSLDHNFNTFQDWHDGWRDLNQQLALVFAKFAETE